MSTTQPHNTPQSCLPLDPILPFNANAFALQALSSASSLAAVIDHTILRPDATRTHILQLCQEAAEHHFACAMINPTWVRTAAEALAGSGTRVGCVIGFPLGATLSSSKREETVRVLHYGAREIDMVLNIGLLKSGAKEDFEAIRQDIRGVAELAHGSGAILKVILETCLLTFEEKLRAADLALSAGADFLKTSTGFSSGGATVDDIALLREAAGNRAGVKASGGIRSLADAAFMLRAGATRIGASASLKILAELTSGAPSAAPTLPY